MKIFLYGTLMSFNSKHFMLKNNKFLGEGILKDYALYAISWYPGIQKKDGGFVKGELYEIDAATKKELDAFEEVSKGVYVTEKVEIECAGQILKNVVVYVYNKNIPDKDKKSIPADSQPWRGNN